MELHLRVVKDHYKYVMKKINQLNKSTTTTKNKLHKYIIKSSSLHFVFYRTIAQLAIVTTSNNLSLQQLQQSGKPHSVQLGNYNNN